LYVKNVGFMVRNIHCTERST